MRPGPWEEPRASRRRALLRLRRSTRRSPAREVSERGSTDHRFNRKNNTMKRILIPIAMIASMVGLIVGPASASTNALTVIYKSTLKPLPANLPSVGAEAYSFNEFGDEITFAPSTP